MNEIVDLRVARARRAALRTTERLLAKIDVELRNRAVTLAVTGGLAEWAEAAAIGTIATFDDATLAATGDASVLAIIELRVAVAPSAITSKPASCDRLKAGHFVRSRTLVPYFELESFGKLAA